MKKLALLGIMSFALVMSGCGSSDNEDVAIFDEDSCNQYMELLSCVVNNGASDDDYKSSLLEGISTLQSNLLDMDSEERVTECENGLAEFDNDEAQKQLKSLGCL